MTTQEIITAMKAMSPIGQCSLTQKEDCCRMYIEDVYKMKNMRRDKEQIGAESRTLEQKLTTSYPHLTLAEVRLAMEAGVTGQFNDLSTVPNMANMIAWIAFYNRSSERAFAQQQYKGTRDIAQAIASRIEREQKASELNARALSEEPEKAYSTYLKEGRNGFVLPQYISEVVYPGLIRMGKMKNISKETLDKCRSYAEVQAKREMPQLAKFGGVNSVTMETYTKREIVFRYFEALKTSGRTSL